MNSYNSKGFQYQKVWSLQQPTTYLPFYYNRSWIPIWVRQFFRTLVYQLLGLVTFWMRLLFLAQIPHLNLLSSCAARIMSLDSVSYLKTHIRKKFRNHKLKFINYSKEFNADRPNERLTIYASTTWHDHNLKKSKQK